MMKEKRGKKVSLGLNKDGTVCTLRDIPEIAPSSASQQDRRRRCRNNEKCVIKCKEALKTGESTDRWSSHVRIHKTSVGYRKWAL